MMRKNGRKEGRVGVGACHIQSYELNVGLWASPSISLCHICRLIFLYN